MEEQSENKKGNFSRKFGRFHDKHYKHLLLIPALILIFCLIYMAIFYSNTGDFIYRDITLTGGTSVTVFEKIPAEQIKQDLGAELEDLNTREIFNLGTGEQEALIVETTSDVDYARDVLEAYLGYELTEENSSIEFTGSSLSQSFFRQLMVAIILAFVFMAIVVFILFRTFVPSAAVIISAFANIIMTLVLVNILGIKMSAAGIVAFLMLIGYSVDTDILLTNRVLKRQGNLNERLVSAFKTGLTMTFTSIVAVGIALIFALSFSNTLSQIFLILFIGLGFDLLNTWVTNVSILKWYALKKNKSHGVLQ